jgi:hypothetical protein
MSAPSCPTGLVPTWVLDILLGEWRNDPSYACLVAATRRVGHRLEVDMKAPGIGSDLCEAAEGYLSGDRLFAHDLLSRTPLGPWVATRRGLGTWRQGGGKGKGRGDLTPQYEALSRHRELSDVAQALLGPVVAFDRLAALSSATSTQDGITVAQVGIEGYREWEAALGGGAWAQEIEREFTLTANHAGWRDRQVRRLVEVSVWAIEMHIDPAPWQELIGKTTTPISVN